MFLRTTLKIVVTGLLFYVLFLKINFQEILIIIQSLKLTYIYLAVLTTLSAVLWSAYKWKVLLDARQHSLSLLHLLKMYFVGLFFNNFFPSSIGGDMVRILKVGKLIGSKSEAAASVILERLLATMGLALVAIFAIIPNARSMSGMGAAIIFFFALCALVVLVFVRPSVLSPLTLPRWNFWQKIIARLRKLNDNIQFYKEKPKTLLAVTLYSIIFQILVVVINYFLLMAMGINKITLGQCMLLIPIISALSMIPLSINGLGIREGTYVLLFTPLGLSASQAVMLSMLFFIIVTIVSLVGGVIFIMEREEKEDANCVAS